LAAAGELRILVNCAGVGSAARIAGRQGPFPLDAFRRVIDVNLVGTFNALRLAAARMSELEALDVPRRGKLLREAIILRLIAIDRAIHAVLFGAIAVGSFLAERRFPLLRATLRGSDLPARIGGGTLPRVRLLDMNQLPKSKGVTTALAPPLVAALQDRIARGEQSLVFLNRRGYAPVLHCGECGWKSGCPHCSAWRVFHKLDRTLRCHHCGFTERVPRACPSQSISMKVSCSELRS